MAELKERGDFHIISLDQPMGDWTGATHILRNAESPGGVIILIGGATIDGVGGDELADLVADALTKK